MKNYRKIQQTLLSLFLSLIMVVQSLSPVILLALPSQAAAQETIPSEVVEETTAISAQPTPAESPSSEPILINTSTAEPLPITLPEEAPPTLSPSSQPIPLETPLPEIESSPTSAPPAEDQPSSPPTEIPSLPPSPTPENNTLPASGHVEVSVIESTNTESLSLDLNPTSLSSASLNTDKGDYSPTESVIISASELLAKTVYTLIISSSDEPAISFQTQITTNDQGSFIYSYQLDGNYRPNYSVEVKDSAGNLVASTSFTDSLLCTTDVDGPNDEPNQKDLTKMCYDKTISPQLIKFNWDEIYGGGNNTYDACTLWDTDSDGKANYSLCARVLANPTTDLMEYNSFILYSCNDTKPDRCGSPNNPVPTVSTSCSATQSSDDPFTLGAAYPQDTVGTCSLDPSNFGSSSYVLLNLCSFPSGQPNSAPADCVGEPSGGFITVVKVASPNDGTAFPFGIAGTSNYSFSINGSGTSQRYSVEDGTYSVSETVPTGWSLDSASCVDNTGSAVGTKSGNSVTGIVVDAGDDITCTFTDSVQQGTLIVRKVVTNNNGGTKTASDFSFQVNGGSATAFESDGQNDLTVTPGTYSISEPSVAGYATSYDNCSNVVVPNGGSATCTITNDDIQPKLTVTKVVVNDNGGTKVVSDFPLFVNSTPVTSGVQNGFNVGTYTVSETSQDGYSAITGGDCATDGSVTLALGDVKSCTITNNDQAATLIVRKVVTNDNGGTKGAADFSFSLNGGAAQAFEADGENNLPVSAGTYTITEPSVTGYNTTYDNCSNIVLANGGSTTCTITNDDIQPKLTVTKVVVNDNGGSATVSDFLLFVNDSSVVSGVQNGFNAGSYLVSEVNQSGYSASISGDCDSNGNITLGIGDVKSCVITNDDQQSNLTVRKVVINDNGGTKEPSDFSFSVNGQDPISFGPENTLTVDAGFYEITEPAALGYTTSYENCSLEIGVGDSETCTITNDDIAPTLTLVKTVINDDGGVASEDDFPVYINDELTSWGSQTLSAGSYTISEGTNSGYTPSAWGGDCTVNGAITLNVGDNKTCSVTNDDRAGKISGKKFSDLNGDHTKDTGEPGIANWTITLDKQNDSTPPLCTGGNVVGELCVKLTNTSGNYSFTGLTPGTYIVSEQQQPGWTQTRPNATYGGQGRQANGTYVLTIGSGDEIDDRDFGNQQLGTITINKIISPADETQWDFRVTGSVGEFDESRILGDGNSFTLSDVPIADYSITEASSSAYTTSFECNGDNGSGDGNTVNMGVSSGENVECTFTNNLNTGTITVLKDIDTNGDGDATDSADIRGTTDWTWDISGSDQNISTGQTKTLPTGTYTINEDQTDSYRLLGWSCTQGEETQAGTTNSITVEVTKDSQTTCIFTNQLLPPVLTLTKANNSPTAGLLPGSNVTYTLTLALTGSPLSDISLTDLLPSGFKYRPGSWTANSSVRGNLKSLGEPTYASPGRWSLGGMNPDEIITLTLIADIDANQELGLYKDLAWAKGTSPQDSGTILANTEDNPFVGTEVAVVKDTQSGENVNVEKEEKKTGEVLGLTTLPNSGASAIWILLSFALAILGGGSIIAGVYLRRKYAE